MPVSFSKLLQAQGRIIGLVLSVCCALALTACGSGSPATTSKTNTPSGAAPPRTAFPMPPSNNPTATTSAHSDAGASPQSFTLLDNRRMKLSDYLGQVVVLDFYATWCPPCREETPHLVELQRRYGSQGLHIIGLNVGGPEDRDKVPDFIEEYHIQYALGFPDPEMTELYLSDDDRIPQAFVFDRKGRLAKRFISYDQSTPAEMESIIQKALTAGTD